MAVEQTAALPRSATLRKVIKLLEGLEGTVTNSFVQQHVRQMLIDYESEQEAAEHSLCAMLCLVLDAFSVHLPQDSPLFAQIRMLQTRLMPPLSVSEYQVLRNFSEAIADQLTQQDGLQPDHIAGVLSPLMALFGVDNPPSHPSAHLVVADILDRVTDLSRERQDQAGYHQVREIITTSAEAEARLQEQLQALRQAESHNDVEQSKQAALNHMQTIFSDHQQISTLMRQMLVRLERLDNDSEKLNHELQRVTLLSLTDELTGLPNRRAFNQRIKEEISRAQRYASPLSLALLDLDEFKRINDQYGHDGGDMVLKHYANEVLCVFRQHDMVARYGGEEFAVILPSTAKEGAVRALKKAQQLALGKTVDCAGQACQLPSFSAGVAVYQPGEPAEDLIKRVDSALYTAKNAGRNCIKRA